MEEKLKIKVRNQSGKADICDLILYEKNPDNHFNVKMELYYNKNVIECSTYNYFDALIKIRMQLEKEDTIILCKGANRNVYPSAMQLNMGSGRKAYRQTIGKQAISDDTIDIFNHSAIGNCVFCTKQKEFYDMWLKSLHN